MKSCSFNLFPKTQILSNLMKDHFGVCKWGAGVNIIWYRDGKDYIGYHSDNTHQEDLIVTVVISCDPPGSRKIIIRNKCRKINQRYQELELILGEGDGYEMDGAFFTILLIR